MKPTELNIVTHLANSDFLDFRKNYACVPNVTYGFNWGNWESDLLVVSKSGYLTEVEVKVTLADWKADKKKAWFKTTNWWDPRFKSLTYFYYAAPAELAQRWPEVGIPDFAGVLGVDFNNAYSPVVLRKAQRNPEAKKVGLARMHALARLGSMRSWTTRNTIDGLQQRIADLEAKNSIDKKNKAVLLS